MIGIKHLKCILSNSIYVCLSKKLFPFRIESSECFTFCISVIWFTCLFAFTDHLRKVYKMVFSTKKASTQDGANQIVRTYNKCKNVAQKACARIPLHFDKLYFGCILQILASCIHSWKIHKNRVPLLWRYVRVCSFLELPYIWFFLNSNVKIGLFSEDQDFLWPREMNGLRCWWFI